MASSSSKEDKAFKHSRTRSSVKPSLIRVPYVMPTRSKTFSRESSRAGKEDPAGRKQLRPQYDEYLSQGVTLTYLQLLAFFPATACRRVFEGQGPSQAEPRISRVDDHTQEP